VNKKLISMLMAALLCLTCLTPAFAEESLTASTVADKLAATETFLYGQEQAGSLITRVDKVEKDLYGQKSSGSVMSRVDRVYNRVEGTPSGKQLSIAAQMNAIEWQFSDRMSTDGAKDRIGALENQIFGSQYTNDTILSRLNRLNKAAFPSGSLTRQAVTLPKDSLIKIKFMEDISSKQNVAGDKVDIAVDDNVYVGEALVLPKGAKGTATIAKVVQPRIFGRDARIDINFTDVTGVSGEKIPVTMGELAKQQAKTAAGAAGASIGGMILFGPVGVVGGAFVKGSSVTIPAGSNTYVQVQEDTPVQGIILAGVPQNGQQAVSASEEELKKINTVEKPDEVEPDTTTDETAVKEDNTKTDRADAETEATVAADEKKQEEAAKKESSKSGSNTDTTEDDEDMDIDLDLAEE
jgi:hypothetical protein